MPASLAEVKAEWRRFRDDEPGERFCNHRRRAMQRSRGHNIVSLALGVLVLAAGLMLLFIPGPGLPLILFGVALVASHSDRLSQRLDHAEPRLRSAAHRSRLWWRAQPRAVKVAIVVGAITLASAGLIAIWEWVVVAYVLH